MLVRISWTTNIRGLVIMSYEQQRVAARRYRQSNKGRDAIQRATIRRRCRADGLSEAETDVILRKYNLFQE